MKRVLVVSPHFPPINAADMHRVRMVLPLLRENGWEAEVVAVRPDAVAAPRDEWLTEGLPPDVKVHRVKALGLGWGRVPSLGTLGWRALPATRRAGDGLLQEEKFDLVYFSSTQWPVHLAGPHWKRAYGVPFAMDYQDPWVNDYYREHPEVVPPGGRWRYALSDRLAKWCEPRVLRECAGFTAVSEAYPRQLRQRYEWAERIPSLVLPFPGAERDFERVRTRPAGQKYFDAHDGRTHWVYVGRGGQDMAPAARALFGALRKDLRTKPELAQSLVLHFIGTSYAGGGEGRATIAPLAAEYGLGPMVHEVPERIPYSEALRCMLDASAVMALCSNDASYTASKIYPCLLAGKPLLVLCREGSGVAQLMEKVGGGVCVTFDGSGDGGDAVESVRRHWLEGEARQRRVPLDAVKFEPFTDRGSARALCAWWKEIAERSC